MGISSIRSKYTPAGANREIQINDNGVLGSSSGFVLNSSGYVGIGVNNPLRGLHLEGDSGISAIRFKTTGGEWDFAPFWSAFDDGNFALNRVSGSGNLLIPSGNVGIGEPSPATILHISQGGEPPAEGMLILEANSSIRQLRIQPPTTADNGFFDILGGSMRFMDDGAEIFRYGPFSLTTSSGIKVGIGTDDPDVLLDVRGDIISDVTNNTYGGLKIDTDSAGDYHVNFRAGRNAATNNGGFVWYTGARPVAGGEWGAGTSRMTLTNAGNLGIGTINPRNLLELGGTANRQLRIGGIYSGPTSGFTADGQETTRHEILFSSWRDVTQDTVGAKITAINKTAWGIDPWYLIQHTDLVFSTLGISATSSDDTTEKMRITSAGDVGIGVDNPTARLSVTDEYDADNDIAFFENTHINGGAFITIKQNETNAQPEKAVGIRLGTKGNINWYQGILRRGGSDHFNTWSLNTSYDNNTAEAKFAVTTDGRVGINVTRVAQFDNANITHSIVLDARTTSTGDPGISITDVSGVGGGGRGSGYSFRTITNDTGPVITEVGKITAHKDNNVQGEDGGWMAFYTKPNGSSISERMRITSSGNVGIGTTNPAADTGLHVVTTSFSGPSGGILMEDARTDVNPWIALKNDAQQWQIQTAGIRSDNFEIWDTNAAATRLSIDTSGNVGIGETAPASLLTLKGGNILLEHNSTGADDGHGIFFHTTTNGWSEAASHAAIYGKRVDASNGYLRFDTRSGGTTAERMRLGSDGVVYVYGEARTGVTVPSNHQGAVLQLRGNTQWEAGYAPTAQNSDHDGVIEFFTSDGSGVGAAANVGKVAGSIRSTALDPYGRYGIEIYTTDAQGDSTTPIVNNLIARFYKYGGNYATGTGSGDGAAQFSLFGASDDTGITDNPGSAIYLNNFDSTVNNYTLLNFRSMVSDGTNYPTAQIRGIKASDNTSGSSWVSGHLAFDTVSDGTGQDSPASAGSFKERMRIHSDGAVSIGNNNLNSTYGILNLSNGNGVGNSALYIEDAAGIGYSLGVVDGSQAFSISEGANLNSQKRFEIDTNGGTIIGGADIRTLYNDGGFHALLYMEGTPRNSGGNNYEWPGISILANNASTGGGAIDLGHAKGTALGNNTAIVDNDSLGALSFAGADGTAIQRGAVMHAQANGDWSGTNRGTDIVFQTTINGTTTYPAERMRIASQNNSGGGGLSGSVLVGKTTADAYNKGENTNLEVEGSISSRTYIASNVGTGTWVNSGFTVGNQMRAYIITIFGRPVASNTYSTAMYVLVSSAYSKVLTQLGTPSSHFGNGELEAQLDSNSAATVNFQVRWAFNVGNTQTSDVYTQVLRLM